MEEKAALRRVKIGIWAYFVLLLVEGSLRKWLIPSLSGPLLLIRDPVAIWIYFQAARGRVFPGNIAAGLGWPAAIAAIFSFLAGMSADASSPLVTVYGLRTDFLHIPLIFIMPRVMDESDVRRMGFWILMAALPMAILMAMQFQASPDAFINAGAGGGHQILSVRGKIRPAGTFSYVTGIVAYFALVTAFFADGLLRRKRYAGLVLIAAGVALLLSMSVSGSRSVVFSNAIVLAAAVFALAMAPWLMERAFRLLAVGGIALLIAVSFNIFDEGMSALSRRFEAAGGQEEIVSRITYVFEKPVEIAGTIPFFGYGLGMGTVAGAALLTGKTEFLLAEDEWSRMLLESGPVLGLCFIAMRFGLAFWMLARGLRSAREQGNILPLLLLGAVGANVVFGQWGQATILGFTALGAGLCLSAMVPVAEPVPAENDDEKEDPADWELHPGSAGEHAAVR